ncbi:MAG: tetratricopeptide repeat protein [Spirochaetia bacterium]|jgi:tetratricopeptide (TPR) repeat protein|nr:tetratricopeptide repeat protein [Spirochaetia bacterium]
MFFVIISIVGIAILIFIILLIKSLLVPRKISSINNLIKNGKYNTAIKITKQLLIKDQTNSELHYLLGTAFQMDGKPELALLEFIKVNELGKFTGVIDEFAFRETIAGLFLQFNQHEEALKEYLLLIKKDPYNTNHQFIAGELFEGRGKIDNAIAYYQKAVELDKRNDKAHFKLGKIYYSSKQLTQAKASFEECLKYNTNNMQAWFFIGKINKDSRNFTAAVAAFEKSQKDPELKMKSIIEKGICHMLNGKIESAILELERAIRLSRESSDNEILYARYFLAACYEKERKIINAVEQWEAIYEKKQGFKDVEKKLSQYQEIRTDDSMKDFLTAGNDKFIEICIKLLEIRGLTERETVPIKNGCQIVAVDKNSGKWRNIKVQSLLVNFFRLPEPIDESYIRVFIEDMKKQNIIKGVIFSASDFTRSALSFIENRPIDIVKKEEMQEDLKKINLDV